MTDQTMHTRPVPKRPENGWLAWVATIGAISSRISPDAMLTVRAYPGDNRQIAWGAAATWGGQEGDEVNGGSSFGGALRELWRKIQSNYRIYESAEDASRQPAGYSENQWLDVETLTTLERLVSVTGAVFRKDWVLMFVYQPVEKPNARVQARLLAQKNSVHIGGRGASLRDALRDLFLNAAREYSQFGR